MPVKSIFDGSTFNTSHTYANLSTCSCEGEKKRKSLNDFKFGTCIGRFPSDVAARMAMKRLMFQPLKQRQCPRKQLLRTTQKKDKTSRYVQHLSSKTKHPDTYNISAARRNIQIRTTSQQKDETSRYVRQLSSKTKHPDTYNISAERRNISR